MFHTYLCARGKNNETCSPGKLFGVMTMSRERKMCNKPIHNFICDSLGYEENIHGLRH